MSSPYADLERPPLSERALRHALLHEGSVWTDIRVVARTASTNSDVAQAARHGSAEGLVLVAEQQDAGRGRLDRTWSSPPRAGLTFSALLRPTAPRGTWSWLPLIAGLATLHAVRDLCVVDAVLKWPNDGLVGERKLAGILAEVVGDAVVIGIGVNVTTHDDELLPTATSLLVEKSAVTDRDTVLRAVLRALGTGYDSWALRAGDSAELRDEYGVACRTVGTRVRVSLNGGGLIEGVGDRIDEEGRLLVRDDEGRLHAVSSGDVQHVRPA